ncbi:MAG: reprolysin-like metallopeptidase [Acidobacteriota bacterium]
MLLLPVVIAGGMLPFFQYAVSAAVGITAHVDAAVTRLQRVNVRQSPLAQGGGQAVAAAVGSSDGIWETPDAGAVPAATRLPAGAGRGVVVRLNKGILDQFLGRAPMEDTTNRPEDQVIISLPLPDGRFSRFRVEESPMLAPELQAAFPDIRTYRVAGLDDATANGRIGWTALGLHAIVIAAGGSVYIDPSAAGDTQHYVSLSKADLPRAPDFVCLVNGGAAARADGATALPLSNGTIRRTYRLVVAATGEYTAAAGGTVALALSRMTATINRVNGIYERELAVRLTLAAGTAASPTALIYTNAATDPYANGVPTSMIAQNQTTIDAVVGTGNYDIGHVFGTNSGGLAGLGVVCIIGNKARGVTGSSNPTGDAFDVDYVAHEMGHQFGGSHTFNGMTGSCNGNRSAAHAYEVGSGSTIMPYAGICGGEDLQKNSDDYFNVDSLNEITTYLAGEGNACAVTAGTSNVVPTVTTPAAFTIPQQTPFTLTATGTDTAGEVLTYAWEQYDLGSASVSPATIGTDDGSRPLFRSYSPTTSNTRTFPSLPFVRNNANLPPQTYAGASAVMPVTCSSGVCATGEVLPSTNRAMHFQVTARDNRVGGSGIRSAQTTITSTTAAGPFRVTAPNTAVKWAAASTRSVTWNVAGSSAAPVSAANVRISLSTDAGLTFPTVILASTANDGSENIVVPNLPSAIARIKIEAVGNIFFDMSDVDFEIEPTPVELALVIDDTGSMPEELGAIRAALIKTINRLATDTTKPFPTTAIVTFKDDVTTRIVSNDPAELQAAVNALVATGGGDCQEAATAALIAAGNLLGAGGTAILFTDADSRDDGPSRADVLNTYLPKSLRLSVLLSGACDESLRPGELVTFSGPSDNYDSSRRATAVRVAAAGPGRDDTPAVLGPEGPVRTFSELALETRGTFAAIPEVNTTADGVTKYINVTTNLAVSAVLPAVSLVMPSAVPQGVAIRVEINGANTNFQGSSTVGVAGGGVTVLSTTVVSSTRILVELGVAAGAAVGFRDVTVTTTLSGATTENALGGGSLQITPPPIGPTILGVTPFVVARGETTDVVITGLNTHFVNGVTVVDLGAGVAINSVTVTSATVARASVTVSAAASVGFRDVRATTGAEVATESVLAGPLLVIAQPPTIPRLVSISPATGRPGSTVNVTLAGANTHFAAGTSIAAFSGTGITVNSVSVGSATLLVANITIAAGAQPGFRDIGVTTSSEVAVLIGGFNVAPAALPFPHLLDLDGDHGGDVFLYNQITGARRLELTGSGTGFNEIPGAWDPGWQIYPANLNADGYTDFFLYDPVRGFWVQAINNGGDGTFTTTLGNWDRSWTVVPSDLDGDGQTDLFVYNVTTGVWVKCLVDGSGGFKGYNVGNWDPGWSFNTADLNGDGRDDFFLYNRSTGIWVEAFSQAGVGGFDYPASGRWDPGWQLYPADLNGDGLTDLFLLNAAGAHVTALSRAIGGFDYAGGPQWSPGWSVTAGDLDGDGRVDLFLYDPVSGGWLEAFSDGLGGFTLSPIGAWDPGWTVGITDVNDDGRADIILSRPDGTWVQARNDGLGIFTYAAGSWGPGWTVFTKRLGDR